MSVLGGRPPALAFPLVWQKHLRLRPKAPSTVHLAVRNQSADASKEASRLGPGDVSDLATLLVGHLYQRKDGDLPLGVARKLSGDQARDLRARFGNGDRFPQGAIVGIKGEGGELTAGGAIGVTPFLNGVPDVSLASLRAPPGSTSGAWQPVISNLVVARPARRRGLGARVVRGLEDIARGWGFEKVWLTVEAVNRPARQLYRKLGYKSMQSATQRAIRAEDGKTAEAIVTVVCMRKSLKGGLAGAIENVRWGELLFLLTLLAALAYAASSQGGTVLRSLPWPM